MFYISIVSFEKVAEFDPLSYQESALESIQEELHGRAQFQYEELLQ
jgi:hypothetical protein